MSLDRIDLLDVDQPGPLARAVHAQLGEVVLPVPVTEIARALDISEIRIDDLDGFEGMLLTDRRRSVGAILANNKGGARRARFTIAHELGHFLMEHHVLSGETGFQCRANDMWETREGRRHQKQETEANQFAIDLLAPFPLVDGVLSTDPDLRDAQRMRDAFDLSLEASVRRMIERRPEPLAAVWSKDAQVRYTVSSDSFPYIPLKKGDRLPQTSQAFDVQANTKTGFTEFWNSPTITWINRPEVEIFEQTRRAPSGYAVTLLWSDMPEDGDEDEDGDDPYHRELDVPGF